VASIAKTVTKMEDGLYTFRCPSPMGCGVDAFDPEERFTSSGWASAKLAQARGQQHIREHVDKVAAPSLDDFRAEHGVSVAAPSVDLDSFLEG